MVPIHIKLFTAAQTKADYLGSNERRLKEI
jgi:hypothetical protein